MYMVKPVDTDRYGTPVYDVNPSLALVTGKNKSGKQVHRFNSNRAVIYDGDTGEMTGEGSVSVLTQEVVDDERFVKMYAASMPVLEELTKPAFSVFKMLWQQVQEKPGLDRAELTHGWAQRNGYEMTYRMHNRGVKELLKKEVIYKSTVPSMYYYNVKFLYNGNRIDALNVMHRYERAGATKTNPQLDMLEEIELPDDD